MPPHPPITRVSGLRRLWNAIKPPPPVESKREDISKEEKLRRRRLLYSAAAAVTVGAVAWGVYQRMASAPLRAEAVFQEGMRLTGEGDFKGAADRFTEAVRIYPRLAVGYYQRGLAHKSMNDVDAAIEDFKQAIGEDSNLAPPHTELGVIYRQRGDPARAMSEFTEAINISSNSDAFYQRGQVEEELGQHQQAIQDYASAIHEQPDAPYVYRARATARRAIGDHEGAQEDLRTALQIEHH